MSCTGIDMLNPVCVGSAIGDGVGSVAGYAATGVFQGIATAFGQLAQLGTGWLWQEISSATALDLTSPGLVRQIAFTGAIAGVLCLALFAIQMLKAALWRDPAALRRGVTGLGVAFLGSAFALATTQLLLTAVDALSAGVVHWAFGTDLSGLGKLIIAGAVYEGPNPAGVLLLALVVIIACGILWATLMMRKLLILVAAVLAPFAFAGGAADLSRSWVRKWVELVAALIASKLLLVVILAVGFTIIEGGGARGSGVGQSTTQVIAGVLVLLVAAFAPWMAIKLFSFAGESMHAAHVSTIQTGAGARAVISAPQKVAALHSSTRMLSAGAPFANGSGSRGLPPAPTAAVYGFPTPSTTSVPGGGPGAGAAEPRSVAAADAPGPAPALTPSTPAPAASPSTPPSYAAHSQSPHTAPPPSPFPAQPGKHPR